MAYIYKIINDINNKVYIGKTTETIQKRWKEHLNDYNKSRYEKRPLYNAMNKYGIEHFHIEEIEYVENIEKLEERETYWIAYYDSYHSGYNATIGGDGKKYLDYSLIYETWLKGYSINEVAKILNCSSDSVTKVLSLYNITSEEKRKHAIQSKSKKVCQIDKDTNKIIKIYNSIHEAERLNGFSRNHISPVCQNKRKLAFGYKWKFLEDMAP